MKKIFVLILFAVVVFSASAKGRGEGVRLLRGTLRRLVHGRFY